MSSKRVAGAVFTVLLSLAVIPVLSTPASAANNCEAHKDTDTGATPDRFRVKAKCTSLNPDWESRGSLDVAGEFDQHTRWFSITNTWYYSSYYRGLPVRGAYHTERHV